jgi:eukaryotic-like serine/threonine-protein kinase
MEPAERDPRIGSVVEGRYRILESMASGSMGVVYRAERVPVGKSVAIKFLHSAFATDPDFVNRFERETRVMSKLAHPHCVSVLDFGVTEGAPYLVMDYVAGTTLRHLIDEHGAMEPFKALQLLRQILAGLAHAHGQDIVHRDIKPANVMITDEVGTGQHVRILDFGLARLRGHLGANATQTHVVVGTPSYMAPEQTVGAAVDARADIYAAGVVLFEMLTGEKPFAAESTLDLMAMHRGAPVPKLLNMAPPGTVLPDGLQRVVEKALAKDPDDRYQTAIEFAAAIDAMLATPASESTPRPPTATVASMMARGSDRGILMLAVLLVAGVGAFWYVRSRSPSSSSKTPAARPSAAVVRADAGVAGVTPSARGADAGPGDVPIVPPVAQADAAVAAVGVLVDAAVATPDAAAAAVPEMTFDAGIEVALLGDGGVDEPEIHEPDPDEADDPDPEGATVAAGSETDEEEAPDAPSTVPEAEVEPPPPAHEAPQMAKTVAGAVRLIKAGKRELALKSLRVLWPKHKASAYIPFLLGNLYFDKRWWSVALDHYRIAIRKNAQYRRNATLNRNVIRMLSNAKTRAKANWFLRKTIGRPAKGYLKWAAKHDRNPKVRQRAAALNRVIR